MARDPLREHFAQGKKVDSIVPKVSEAVSKLHWSAQLFLSLAVLAATLGLGGVIKTWATPATATGKQTEELQDKLKESDARFAQLQKALEKTELKQWMERTESDLAAIKSAIDPVRLGERRQNAEIAKLRSAVNQLNGGPPHPTWNSKAVTWEAPPLAGLFAMVDGVPALARKPLHITSTTWEFIPKD